MTPQEGLSFILDEFVARFGASAEGCCKAEDTITAIRTLALALGLTHIKNQLLEDFIAGLSTV